MNQRIALTTVVVRDYDEAIAFYVDKLGFEVRSDERLSATKRWVVVAPSGDGGAGILLARAADDAQARAIGDQAGGRVFLFLETDDFDRDHAAYLARGVRFAEKPRLEPYGKVAVFEDLYGNRWDLIEPASAPARPTREPERPANVARDVPPLGIEQAAVDCHSRRCPGAGHPARRPGRLAAPFESHPGVITDLRLPFRAAR